MDNYLIEQNLTFIKNLIEDSNNRQDDITEIFMKNFERFANRITKIEMELFGKSEE